jgi:hypothetical protein
VKRPGQSEKVAGVHQEMWLLIEYHTKKSNYFNGSRSNEICCNVYLATICQSLDTGKIPDISIT